MARLKSLSERNLCDSQSASHLETSMSEESDQSEGFINEQGCKIFCKYWQPEISSGEKPKALVFMCHGYAEHCLYYDALAKAFNQRGMFVFSHDHEGHGKSGGCHVNIMNFDIYVNDVIKHVTLMQEKYPNVPTFIVGHSMGGLIATKVLLEKPELFKGTALIGPAIGLAEDLASPLKVLAVKVVGKILPNVSVAALDPNLICRDPAVVKYYNEDPLVYHGKVKSRFALEMYNAQTEVQTRFSEMDFPFLIVHGAKDAICTLQGPRDMYEKSPSKDKQLEEYPDAYHQLHYEIDGIKDKVTDQIVEWIEKRT